MVTSPPSPAHQKVTIRDIGREGDGIGQLENGQVVFVPGTLPGEEVKLRLNDQETELLERLNDSPVRVEAGCSLAGICGGCVLQHMQDSALLDWKVARVEKALGQAGFQELPPPQRFQAAPHTRRRMDFALQRVEGGITLGLHARKGAPVDMTACLLLHPRLAALLPPLREVLGSLGALTGRGGLNVNLLDSGPDLTLETPAPLSSSDQAKLAAFAKEWDIPRISWRAGPGKPLETVAQWQPVHHQFSQTKVSPPAGAFMQATQEMEAMIAAAVIAGLPALNRKDRIFELYAGCGTLTFPLAQHGHVQAYEGHAGAIAALQAATHGTRVTGFSRDLNRQPLLPQDLKAARVVVLDPPHAGAGAQIAPLVRSEVRDVVYVSCNPQALETDLASLAQAGFEVLAWTVIDQFLWSAEVESVIVLSRDPKRIRKARKAAA
ncbi:class I SAM-dependent RNA methyltransferase [Oecophyllibacter saccharovorans]|uniref:class I SAM-dependent RNA methyltransferase n=1 Tax=Oecophyllibacter saccharovorans TaxID=2558360 RepID=UPI001143A84D|nr:TRAM domain-containing protein [Oecophyllibacter saccharovorans]QDH14626.1 class I SAM-dependent RNA methyltransferase [Oecophyllibacter saccharovorans]